MITFQELYEQYHEKEFVIMANANDYSNFSFDKNVVYIALNASLKFFESSTLVADFLWIQDLRFFQKKEALFLPSLESAKHLFFSSDAKSLENITNLNRDIFWNNPLGHIGFSTDITVGFYHGYNSAFGALQLVYFFKPKKVTLIGVELSYSLVYNRYYNQHIDFDYDFHVLEKGLFLTNFAKEQFQNMGIEFTIENENSKVSRFLITQNEIA